MEVKVCKCGCVPEIVKVFETRRPDCFVRCPECGSETKCYTSRQNAVKAWNADRLYIGETAEIVEKLRKRAEAVVRDKKLMLDAADMLEDLRQDVDEWIAGFDMLNARENRHKYLDYWREKNGKDELWYPDGDEVYKDFFDMKARVEKLEKERDILSAAATELYGEYCNGSEWIGVNDKLPESDGKYLVCTQRKKIHVSTFYGGTFCCFSDESRVVTHWMALPEPPENNQD